MLVILNATLLNRSKLDLPKLLQNCVAKTTLNDDLVIYEQQIALFQTLNIFSMFCIYPTPFYHCLAFSIAGMGVLGQWQQRQHLFFLSCCFVHVFVPQRTIFKFVNCQFRTWIPLCVWFSYELWYSCHAHRIKMICLRFREIQTKLNFIKFWWQVVAFFPALFRHCFLWKRNE